MAKNGGNSVGSVKKGVSGKLVPNQKKPVAKKGFGTTFSAPKKP